MNAGEAADADMSGDRLAMIPQQGTAERRDALARSRKFVFVQNARSGDREPAELRNRLTTRLERHDAVHRFLVRSRGQSLSELIATACDLLEHEEDCLVAVGGDGTVNLAAAAAIAGGHRLGIIPAGTFNFVARNYNIPEEPDAALDLLLDTAARPVQAAAVNGHVFLVNASIGLYAKLLREREHVKNLLGRNRIVAALSALLTALRPYRSFDLVMREGERHTRDRAATLIVANNRLQLRLIGIDLPSEIGQGALFGALLRPVSRLALLDLIWRGSFGDIRPSPALDLFTLQRLEVGLPHNRRRRVRVAVDGELIRLRLPLEFGIETRPLWLVHRNVATTLVEPGAAARSLVR